MWAVSEIADWWNEQHQIAKKELDIFVDNNPNLFGVIVGTAVATAMDVGAGTMDMLRFGEGAGEGGVKGVGKDALRLIGLMGPLGKGAKILQTAANARLARAIVDTGGPICGYVSGAQAFRQTGTKAFVMVDDLAASLGKSFLDLGGSRLANRIEMFSKIGAKILPIKSVTSIEEIASMTKSDGSVTMFSIVLKKGGGHALNAFRDFGGRLKILDRGGAGKAGRIFDTFKDLEKQYGEFTVREAAVMVNVFAKYVASVTLPVFALDAYALAGVKASEHLVVAQAFEVHKFIIKHGKKALESKNPRYHIVLSGDWLSKIAKTFYGDMHKWPVIYEANRDIIGKDPNLIIPGQRLLIPDLPKVGGIKG
jgi:hypothetical protein